jgi:hypothetical protein
MPHSIKHLSPYKGHLHVVEIVDEPNVRLPKPLDLTGLSGYLGNEAMPGNFNNLPPESVGFAALASESGRRFFTLFGRD